MEAINLSRHSLFGISIVTQEVGYFYKDPEHEIADYSHSSSLFQFRIQNKSSRKKIAIEGA